MSSRWSGSPETYRRAVAQASGHCWARSLAVEFDGFRKAKAAHGPTTFGTFSCSKATNEVNFAAQKFSRTILGSNNIDSCNRT